MKNSSIVKYTALAVSFLITVVIVLPIIINNTFLPTAIILIAVSSVVLLWIFLLKKPLYSLYKYIKDEFRDFDCE